MPVTNVPQQAGLEGVGSGYNPAPLLFPNNGLSPARGDAAAGVAPARGDAAAGVAPARGDAAVGVPLARGDGAAGVAPAAEAIVPQEKVEQIARETVAFATE